MTNQANSLQDAKDKLSNLGYRLMCEYDRKGWIFQRWQRNGIQYLIYIELKGFEVIHWEIFREISDSNVTTEYLDAIR